MFINITFSLGSYILIYPWNIWSEYGGIRHYSVNRIGPKKIYVQVLSFDVSKATGYVVGRNGGTMKLYHSSNQRFINTSAHSKA